MKTYVKILGVIVLVAVMIFAGILYEQKSVDVTAEQIRKQVIENIGNVESYKFSLTSETVSLGGAIRSTDTGQVDVKNNRAYKKTELQTGNEIWGTVIFERYKINDTFYFRGYSINNIKNYTYVVNDTTYVYDTDTGSDDFCKESLLEYENGSEESLLTAKEELSINDSKYEELKSKNTTIMYSWYDIRGNILDLLFESSESAGNMMDMRLRGKERINGTDCWVIEINFNIREIYNYFGAKIPTKGSKSYYPTDASAARWIYWVETDTYYLRKLEKIYENLGPVNSIKSTYTFYDYNKPVSIELPKEAENAVNCDDFYS